MTGHFDLLHEEWIPCAYGDGLQRRGVVGALRDASTIEGVCGKSPLDTFSIYRFLIAVTAWSVRQGDGPRMAARGAKTPAYTGGELAEAVAKSFFGGMPLLGREERFLQQADAGREATRPVSDLYAELPGGTEINHFRHTRDDAVALCPACAAIGLLRLPAFCQSRLAGSGVTAPASINGTPPVYFLPLGRTLLETLLINLPQDSRPDDPPSWEGAGMGRKIGVAEGFTWQPRETRLATGPDQEGRCAVCGAAASEARPLIRRTVFGVGRRRTAETTREWRDPHVAYLEARKKKPGQPELVALHGPDPIKRSTLAAANWRRCAKAIIDSLAPGKKAPPVGAVEAAVGRLPADAALRILCVEPHTREAKSYDYRAHVWCIPGRARSDLSFAVHLSAELDWFDGALGKFRAWAIKGALGKNSNRKGLNVAATFDTLVPVIERGVRDCFARLLGRYDATSSVEPQRERWRAEVRRVVAGVSEPALSRAGPGFLQRVETVQRLRVAVEQRFFSGGDGK